MTELLPENALRIAFQRLDALKLNEILVISDFAPRHPALFTDCAKQYFSVFGNIRFNSTMDKVKKVRTFAESTDGEEWQPKIPTVALNGGSGTTISL